MRRWAIIFVCIILIIIIAGLCQTAWDPDVFTGTWYSSKDQTAYQFQEGLVYSSKFFVPLSDTESISGAYTFCKDSIYIFVSGIEGLETEQELYLVTHGNESFLCENKEGTGRIYFIRYSE